MVIPFLLLLYFESNTNLDEDQNEMQNLSILVRFFHATDSQSD